MYNKVILVGRLGRDSELRYTGAGAAVCNFSLAVGHRYKQGETTHEETYWGNIVVWGKQAEFCGEYLKKGTKVLVEGRLQTKKWETDSGERREKTEIVANSVRNLSERRGEGEEHEGEDATEDSI